MSTTATTSATAAATQVIVLTGASGFLGQHCLRELIEHDTDVAVAAANDDKSDPSTAPIRPKKIIYALVHQTSSQTELEEAIPLYYTTTCDDPIKNQYFTDHVTVITVALDLTSPTACDKWFESIQQTPPQPLQPHTTSSNEYHSTRSIGSTIDCCIHTAALSSPAICEQQPEYARSINVPTYFFERLLRHNPNITIIALSTDQVYDGNISVNDSNSSTSNVNNNSDSSEYYKESSKCEPCNVYGTTKVALESFLMQQQQLQYPHALIIVLRSSILLGPKVPFLPHRTHSSFLHFCHSRRQEATTYYTNEIRSVIAVSDVVRVIVQMMQHYTATPERTGGGVSEVYCMGGPTPVTRYDMAKAVLSYFQIDDPSNEIAVPVRKESPPTTDTTTNGSVKSPLNISMDSTKLLQFMRNSSPSSSTTTTTTGSISSNYKFLTLSDIVVQTFSEPQAKRLDWNVYRIIYHSEDVECARPEKHV